MTNVNSDFHEPCAEFGFGYKIRKKGKSKTKDARLEALERELKLTQEIAHEKSGTLEAAIKEIIELKTQLEVMRGRSKKKQEIIKSMKEELLQTTESKMALQARIKHLEFVVMDQRGKLNSIGVASVPSDVHGVNTINKLPPTVIPTPRNHRRVASKFDRADLDKPEIQKYKYKSNKNFNSDPLKLSDSPAFQIFWKNLGVFMKAIPNRRKLLSPVCGDSSWTKMDLKGYLDAVYKPRGFTQKFIFFLQGLLRWGPDKINALAFAPLCIIKDGLWTRNDEFENVDGDTIEVFFLGGTKQSLGVCYAGTYKCYHTHDYFPEGVFKPKDISTKSLSRLTVDCNDEDALQNCVLFGRKYETGDLKADSAILQCVTFNEEIYEKLSESSHGNASKRKTDSEDRGGMKRVRT